MMGRIKKRIISLLLAVTMVAGFLPGNIVIAEEGTSNVTHSFNFKTDLALPAADKAEIAEGTKFADYFTSVGNVKIRTNSGVTSLSGIETGKNGDGGIQFTVATTAVVTAVVGSTGSSNTSTIGLKDATGALVAEDSGATTTTGTGGETTTTGTGGETITYTNLPAGTYTLISPDASTHDRGARIHSITVEEVANTTPVTKNYAYDFKTDLVLPSSDKTAIEEGIKFADYFTSVGDIKIRTNSGVTSLNGIETNKNGDGGIQFTVTGTANMEAVVASTGSSNTSSIGLKDATGTLVAEDNGATTTTGTGGETITFTNLPAGTYTLVSPDASTHDRGARIFSIKVTETTEGGSEPARAAWDTVAAPVVNSVAQNGSAISVDYTMLIGNDGADQVNIIVSNADGVVDTKTIASPGTGGTASFTLAASGAYSVVACATRSGETAKDSAAHAINFVLPLGTPKANAYTGAESGSMVVSWSEVAEATGYQVSYSEDGTNFTVPVVVTGTTTIVTGLTVGASYTFKVAALRNDEVANASASVEAIVRESEEREWIAAYFGTSTSATANKVEGNIFDGLMLNAVTYKADGSVDKKGGKLTSDGYDGITYYYTKVDAATENFVLTGTFTIDYLQKSAATGEVAVDGQDGFGIIIRDSIGQNGVSGSAFYTNSVGAVAMKVGPYLDADKNEVQFKNGFAARFVTGLLPGENGSISDADVIKSGLKNSFKVLDNSLYTENYQKDENILKVGQTYTFTVIKDNTGYRTQYTNAAGETVTQTLYDPSALLKMDSENVYVGFAAARGANVSVSNISFTTSNPATDAPAEEEPDTFVALNAAFTSATSSATEEYNLVFKANADGVLSVALDGNSIATDIAVVANQEVVVPAAIKDGTNKFTGVFQPNDGFVTQDGEKLESYAKVDNLALSVTRKTYGTADQFIVVAPGASKAGQGTYKSPLALTEALKYVQPGQTILMQGGVYQYETGVAVQRGIDGTAENPIFMMADPANTQDVVLDFMGAGTGYVHWADYWHVKDIVVRNTAPNFKGVQVAGNNNIFENIITYNNGDTGFQISGSSAEPFEKWPANNLVLNCTSFNNADPARENADGFAAKLTSGPGNVFYGCLAFNNADDGWDCFAKIATGPIGAVTLINCVTFGNGYLLDGEDAGNGNGFKMGGSAISGHHIVINSISYDNKAKGIDSNSCPDIEVYNSTSYNNESYNIALYSNSGVSTAFVADGIVSFKDEHTSVAEQLKETNQASVKSATNYFHENGKTTNINGDEITADMFVSLDTSVIPTRNADGSLNMHGLLELKANAPANAGAVLANPDYSTDEMLSDFGDLSTPDVSTLNEIPHVEQEQKPAPTATPNASITIGSPATGDGMLFAWATVQLMALAACVSLIASKKKKN